MSDRVYVTYENSPKGVVTGVYANETLAKKERDERGDLSIIDSFELKGYNAEAFEYEISDKCKYYKPHLNTIRELISCLYNLEGCCCGGLAHVVVDDNNYEDYFLNFVLSECEKEENKNRTELGLVKLICEELKRLSIQERALIFSGYYVDTCCDHKCENCCINKGIEVYEN